MEFVSMTGENFWEASGLRERESKESFPPATGSSGATIRREKINRSTDQPIAPLRGPPPFPSSRSRLRDRMLVLSRTRLDLLDRDAQKSPICHEENLSRYATLRAIRNAWITREQERKENLGDCDHSMKTRRDLCNREVCLINSAYIIHSDILRKSFKS